jgi:hypothetical protein
MYTLLFISSMAYLGTYADLPSCQHAIREIFATQTNPPGKRLPELEESINLRVNTQKTYICVPTKKN